jgi:phosphate-selective porin
VQVHEAELTPHRAGQQAGLVEEDLDTERVLLRRGDFTLQMGGMLQVQGAFYVGDEAGLVLDDPADTEGFRVRRARFGFAGRLFSHWSYYIAVDLKDTVVAAQGGDHGNEILDAKIEWHRFPFARVIVGVDKVPYSALALQSSSRLTLIERPLMVGLVAPDRRVGLTVEGDLLGLQYAAGLYNGSEGVTSGNRMAGVAGAAHLQYNILGKPQEFVPSRIRLGLGGGYMYDDGPAVADHRASGNLAVQGFRVRLQGELLWMQSDPKGEPTGSEIIAGDSTRWGVAAELSAFVLPGRWSEYLQVAARYEYYQDVEELVTFGNQQLITAGLNLYLFRHNLKLQVNYIHRDEREGTEMANDVGFAQIQAMF